jgi:hypothetical protein
MTYIDETLAIRTHTEARPQRVQVVAMRQNGMSSVLRTTLAAVAGFIAAVVLLGLLVVAGGGVAAVAVRVAPPDRWQTWADVGDAFGVLNSVLSGLAFAALGVTLWVQFRELALQRAELRMQRGAIERSGAELRRSADASLRTLHFELLKMGIDDPLLAEVWPDPTAEIDPAKRRQLLYANLVFQHVSLSMLVAQYTDEQMREALRYVFESAIMRDYWARSAGARRRTDVPGTDPWRIAQIADDVWQEHVNEPAA